VSKDPGDSERVLRGHREIFQRFIVLRGHQVLSEIIMLREHKEISGY